MAEALTEHFPGLLSKWMILFVLGVSLQSFEAVGKRFSEPRTRGLNWKQYLRLTNIEYLHLQPNKKAHGSTFSFFRTRGWLATSWWKVSNSTVLAYQCKKRYKSQHSWRVHCVLGMHLHSFESAGRRLFVHLELVSDVPKQSFPLVKPV